jgi:16S rRNA (cytidine1402-2'-O)-methyltransferase
MTSTVVFFESPHRVAATLDEIAIVLGNRPMFVARELTKAHQQLMAGSVLEVIGQLTNQKGEFTFVIGPGEKASVLVEDIQDSEVYGYFCLMTNEVTSRRAAVAAVAQKYGRTTKSVYAAIERVRRLAE